MKTQILTLVSVLVVAIAMTSCDAPAPINPDAGLLTPEIVAKANFTVDVSPAGNFYLVPGSFGIGKNDEKDDYVVKKDSIDQNATVFGLESEPWSGRMFLKVTFYTYDKNLALTGHVNVSALYGNGLSGTWCGEFAFTDVPVSNGVPADVKKQQDVVREKSYHNFNNIKQATQPPQDDGSSVAIPWWMLSLAGAILLAVIALLICFLIRNNQNQQNQNTP